MPKFKRSALYTTAMLAALVHAPSAFAGISVLRMATEPMSTELIEAMEKDRQASPKEELKKEDAPVVNKPVVEAAPKAMPLPAAPLPVKAEPKATVVTAPAVTPVTPVVDVVALPMPVMKAEVPSAPPARTWNVAPNDLRLANTLDRWSKEAGMRLIWDAKKHVIISTSDSYTGTLEEALNRVLGSPAIRKSAYPLEACIYPNTPPVIRITRLGEQIDECPQ